MYTVKAESEEGNLVIKGPNAGIDLGFKVGSDTGVSAMAELSVAKAEISNGPLYASLNLNSNTGLKIGNDGCKVGLVGFGLTLGVGGKWTIDTPFGSVGGTSASTVKNKDSKKVLLAH
jgi:hypothetical protein